MRPTKKAVTKSIGHSAAVKPKRLPAIKKLKLKTLELRNPKKGVRAKKNAMKPFKPAKKVKL